MELVRLLDDLDAHPWASYSHAYGSAEDLPDLLRALAGADEEAADEALSELHGSVLHQGTVYGASAEAVPFLAGIAAAGHRTTSILMLLGGLAESEDEHGVTPGAVRAAVTERLALLLPLLAAADPGTRETAAWALSQTRATAKVLPALRDRWEEESAPAARAEVLAGIARLDPQAGAESAATALGPSEPGVVRLAAVFAHLDAGAPWTGELQEVMQSLLPADPLCSAFDLERNEPLSAVVEVLLSRDDSGARGAAFDLLDAALRDGRAEVRAEAVWSADHACRLSRSAPERLVPALCATAVADAQVVAVASLLGKLGDAAAPAADVLAPLAGRTPDRVDDEADRVLAALVRVTPLRAAPLLAAGLGRRPRALDAAAGFGSAAGAVFPFDVDLLDAVRHRLARPEELSGNEPGQLANLLTGWGLDSIPVPALARTMPPQAEAHRAPDRADLPSLRAAAERGDLSAAQALHDLEGELTPLLRCLEGALREGSHRTGEAAAAAGALGSRGVALAPALREALGGPEAATTPALDVDTALAEALWHVTGEAKEAVAVLDSVFARAERIAWSRWSVVRAARATARLGPAGRPLTARLAAALDVPEQVPAAVLALVAVSEAAAQDRPALAGAVLRAAEQEADPTGACDALEALGRDAMTDDHVRRLAVLADGDARVVRSGVEDRIIGQDEAFRERARALLAAFTAATTAPATHTGCGSSGRDGSSH